MVKRTRLTAALILSLFAMPSVALGGDDGEKAPKKYNAYEEFSRANRLVSYGGYSRAIPHYKRALVADPANYSIAHYNLGEVYRAKGSCASAAFHYQAYINVGNDPESVELSRSGVRECAGRDWGRLKVSVADSESASISIDGFEVSYTGKLGEFMLAPGKYKVVVSRRDHITQERVIEIKPDQGVSEESFTLEKMTFFGKVGVSVNVDNATVKIIPKQLDKKSEQVESISATSPHKTIHEFPTGKYLVEVNLDGYDRWVRHVYVTRGSEQIVEVRLTESLPDWLR